MENMQQYANNASSGFNYHVVFITNMAVHRHNRSVESLYKNSHLRGLSYK
ncbi:hypothetical protein MTBBW1_350050 [Desulfamplus magnetovallimortis]|uniref:Uncharacterized protein n=1 Tax=Desulfamplus magnetovallimortis TaxID=1246637 RepID=A0A1W1HGF1_9BACT|nr:hypothetical protein MTBBW1_350050 [Desulfamplus magnetovallimortis]